MGLYLGWVCVATIANVTALLVDVGITGGTTAWAVTILVVGIYTAVVQSPARDGATVSS